MSEQNELDQILVPVSGGKYRAYGLMNLLGFSARRLRSASGFGMAPLHFITQRGPLQDGVTVLDMRLDVRTIQIVVAEALSCRTDFWDRRYDILDMLRPNRSFGATCGVRPLIYKKWLPSGKIQRGSDLVIEGASSTVTSVTARFVHWGLEAGQTLTVSGATAGGDNDTFTILSVPNDYTLILNHAFGNDETVRWEYRRGWGKRDLYCLLEEGPHFDMTGGMPFVPQGYLEALRFVAHDPMWYGQTQTETWVLPDELGDLVFDGNGAWFGATAGTGRWLFLSGFVGETVSLTYWGTVGAKPLVEIDGPADDVVVENVTTGARIEVDYTIALDERVSIDTLALTVMDNAGTNLMPYTSGDMATFSIEPAPVAPNRQNDIYVSFSSGIQGQSAARLYWRNRYIGI